MKNRAGVALNALTTVMLPTNIHENEVGMGKKVPVIYVSPRADTLTD